MRDPKIILDILNKRSNYNLTIDNIYPILYKQSIYLLAYNKLTKNKGILTKGETEETVDGTSIKRIDKIIDEMRYERYQWHKSRVIEIPKKHGGFRQLSVPEWRDKLVQEVLYMILNAIYEPKFLDSSHGFRQGRGCHTALQRIQQQGQACEYFIEGDIVNCFDKIDHNILLNILRKTIKDNRFIELIRKMLKAGKFGEDFIYNKTYSGTPQGGVLSPLLANIYLTELDKFIEYDIKPMYHNNIKREESKEYRIIRGKIQNEEKKLKRPYPRMSREESIERLKQWRKELRQIKFTEDIYTTKCRRLCYTRYADDWIISFTGTFEEAKEIKQKIKTFLNNDLKLELSDEKTKITKSDNQKNPTRFLNYNIIAQWSNTKITNGKRSMIGTIAFLIPNDVINEKIKPFMKNGKPVHLGQYLANPVFDIIKSYQDQYSGICQYYKFARNQEKLTKLKWVMEQSLTKTLANKLRTSVSKIYNKYSTTKLVDGYNYKVIQESITDKNGKIHITYFGAIPLKRQKFNNNIIHDPNVIHYYSRNSLASRLINNVCELCGSDDNVQIHHIKHMKDIKNNKSEYAKRMIAMNRKTLAVCQKCHNMIHNGKYDGRLLK